MITITSAILETTADWIRASDVENVREINEGLCADFANAIHKQFPDAVIVGVYDADDLNGIGGPYSKAFANAAKNDLIGHTALKYNGIFYDAEAHSGVARFEDLPICSAALL